MIKVTRKEAQDAIEQSDKYILKSGDIDRAIQLLEKTLEKLDGTSEEYYEILLKLSKTYRDNRNYTDALDLLERSVKKAKKFNKKIYLGDIYRSISFIKLHQQKFVDAKRYAKKALNAVRYMRGFKAQKSRANIYAVLGNIYFTTKKYEDALVNYRKALKKSEDIGFKQREITVKNDIANVYIEREEFEKAKSLLLSIKEDGQKEYPLAVPQILLRLARVEHLLKRDDKAESYIMRAIGFAQEKGWSRDVAEGSEALAQLYKKQGRDKDRKSELKKAYKTYKEIGLKEKAEDIRSKISS